MSAVEAARCRIAHLVTELRLSVRYRFHARGLSQDAINDNWPLIGGAA